MSERIDSAGLSLEERIIDIWRCSKVVKGGRRFSFAAMTVVGNGDGVVGVGYGKAREVPGAIDKAVKAAKKNLFRVSTHGTTIPHEVCGRYGAARVLMIPARPGTGVIAGASTRNVLECIGVRDVLSKCIGKTNNAKNVVRATLEGLLQLRSREDISKLRGVTIEEDPQLAESLRAKSTAKRESFSTEDVRGGRAWRGTKKQQGDNNRGRGKKDAADATTATAEKTDSAEASKATDAPKAADAPEKAEGTDAAESKE